MGIRMTHPMGLSPRASKLVAGQEITVHHRIISTFPDGTVVETEEQLETSDVHHALSGKTFTGMFDDEYPLMRYTLAPGDRVLEEVVQETVWSSGPCIFLTLTENGAPLPEMDWTPEEMAAEA